MTKKFCDICGEPAVGHPIVGYGATRHNAVRLSATFTLVRMDQANDTEPDLCAKCRAQLLHDLWAKYSDGLPKTTTV